MTGPRVVFAGGGTGGHLYPAIAIAKALRRIDPGVRPFFIGARRGIDRDVLPTTQFEHALLELHPIYRSNPLLNWKTLAGAVAAWRDLDRLHAADRPRLVVGTGGYAMGLAAAHALAHGVPVVQQVADSHPGITARLVARWSKEVYLGFPEAASMIRVRRGAQVVDAGNPIEPPPNPRPDRGGARERLGFPRSGGRVLVVFGGSQGSRAVNEALAGWIARGLPPSLYVVWATGKGHYEAHRRLDSAHVRVVPYLSPIADAYAACDLAVARGGAISTAELCAWAIPMILVPLPTAAADHQTSNARALEGAGAAVNLPQRELTPERLEREVTSLLDDGQRFAAMAHAATTRSRPDAAERIARRIIALIDRPA